MNANSINPPVTLEARFRHYAWGDLTFIPELYGVESTGEPCAEAWLGAHPALPALARCGDERMALDALIAGQPLSILGPAVARRFVGLPYLLKILAVATPLSIQVHPSSSEAAAGFCRENDAGLAPDSPRRNYRDASHKPEFIVALTDFYALCGFRPAGQIARLLGEVPELYALLPRFEGTAESLRDWLKVYYKLPDERIFPALARWLARLEEAGWHPRGSPQYWTLKAHHVFSPQPQDRPDRGLVFFLLLNLIKLEPWQGLYLSAGMPHSYLQGAGVEIMANSDNVVRGGLTAKHVDVDELLCIVRFDFACPPIVAGAATALADETVYSTPAGEFELRVLRMDKHTVASERIANGPEILLALRSASTAGPAVAVVGHRRIELRPGDGCLIPHGTAYRITAAAPATLVRIVVPITVRAQAEHGSSHSH